MCGIHVLLGACSRNKNDDDDDDDTNDTEDNMNYFIKRRGPDSHKTITTMTPIGPLTVTASVLHLRGKTCTQQPVKMTATKAAIMTGVSQCSYLCWNGELYHDSYNEILTETENETCSDTLLVASRIERALFQPQQQQQQQHHSIEQQDTEQKEQDKALLHVLTTLNNAEYSMVVTTPNTLYYARDPFGRRSLVSLTTQTTSKSTSSSTIFQLSSVATSKDWTELTPSILHCYSLHTGTIRQYPIVLPTLQIPVPIAMTLVPCPFSSTSTSMWQASLQLESLLQQAVQRRCTMYNKDHSIGILFSGGLDSVVLASMACRATHQRRIELWNVAFDPIHSKDRIAALASYQELKHLYPHSDIQLHCIDKTWHDIVNVESHVKVLLYPKDTVMDMNIGCAIWFAAQGNVTGHGRVLLLGMGADEQMGGYTRHRTAASRGMLRHELTRDTQRLWERNLGRDDRLVSDHGKEARFPYLDEAVVQFLKALPEDDLCDFSLPPGQGDKRILRLVAQRHGLVACTGLIKRAIQFGSRISHVSDAQRFGSRRQAKGEKRFDNGNNNHKKNASGNRVVVHGDGTVVVHGKK